VEKLRRAYDAAKWEETIAAVAQSERYNGVKLTPTVDLVPLGEDPDSGLSEFAHVQSGAVPERDPQGRLKVTAETGVILVLVPGGTFRMGSDKVGTWEMPIREVTVPPFFMAKHELTEGQLARLTGKESTGDGLRPAVNVSFDDAKQLAVPLGLRLPTEAEWEYAARAGTTTEYWWGEEVQQGGKAWANCGSCGSKWDGKETAPVGSFAPNPFGLYDTAGNVWEWVEDCYHDSYAEAPTDGSAWVSGSCRERVRRGGSWVNVPAKVRSAIRGRLAPSLRNLDFGLRLARTLP
jgi:formylglycine-generating enzyme required for sulfatase activity